MARSGVPSGDTLDARINALSPGTVRSFLEREASLTIDGALLRHEPFMLQTADPREHRGARPFLEILTLARGLAFLGEMNATATRATHPDFEVTLADGRHVGVEATDAYDTGIYEGRLQQLRLALLNAVDASGTPLSGRLVTISAKAAWDTGLAVNLGSEPDVPAEAFPFRKPDVASFVAEFLTWLAAGEHRHDRAGLDPFSNPAFPEMTRQNVVITSSAMTGGHPGAVEFTLPSIGQSADQVKAVIAAALARKQLKAANYGTARPLWLFIEVADRAVRAPRALEELVAASVPTIAPYALVVVIHGGIAVAIDAGGIRRMDLASSDRPLPFWPV